MNSDIKIYSIGVGTSEPVRYGIDQTGSQIFFENTFTDKDLKKISKIAGGEYYWAKDEKEIKTVLYSIFND